MNTRERIVASSLEEEDWHVLRNGWPDFLCVRQRNGHTELKAVEVKALGEKVPSHQRKIHKALRAAGIKTQVMRTSAKEVPANVGELALGRALAVASAGRGLSQKALADKAGVDPSHVSLIQMGKRSPSMQTLGKFCKALKVSLSELTGLAQRLESGTWQP